MSETPILQYKIPYEEWYLIVTSRGVHFYFNRLERKSYWQLYDVFEDNTTIDKNVFISCINVEDIAILMSKVNGLKGLDGYFFKVASDADRDQLKPADDDSRCTQVEDEDEVVASEEADNSDDKTDETQEYDEDAKDEFVRHLLVEEGYINESKIEETALEDPGGLDLGYSSSEDESEADENQAKEGDQDNEKAEKYDGLNESEDEEASESDKIQNDNDNENDGNGNDDENQDNLDLDLSLSDDGSDITQDFFRLLDSFKDRISIYDPWFLIEEELLSELITKPEYYSINASMERERIFNQWCKMQQMETQENNTDTGVEENKNEMYPSLTQMFFKFLQNHKKELKKLFYSEFRSKFANKINLTFGALQPKEIESLYRQYKIMIADYAEYEKRARWTSLNDTNLKKQKLDQFLSNNNKKLSVNSAKNEDLLQVENSSEDAFDKWIKICNFYNIPPSIGDNVENFIVGDEKRLQSYIEMITRP